MQHGEEYFDNDNRFMYDHINGTDWHIPDNSDVLNNDGSWNDSNKDQ